jgi:hypothetical protein
MVHETSAATREHVTLVLTVVFGVLGLVLAFA